MASAAFELRLDTRAPVVAWGTPGGTFAGELLQIGYTSDEPIAAARLRLADGRNLTVTVAADRVSVLLPYDAPAGLADLYVSDKVLNETRSLRVDVQSGVAPTPAPGGAPTLGPRDVAPTRIRSQVGRRITRRSRVEAKSTWRSTGADRKAATVVVASVAGARMSSRTSQRLEVASEAWIAAALTPTRQRVLTGASHSVSRADGEDDEAALVLDLL